MDRQLRKLMRQTVYARAVESYSDGGNEVLGEARAIPAYVEAHIENVQGGGGMERKLMTLVICELPITESDRVYLPGVDQTDDHAGQRPDRVVSFPDMFRDDTVDHYEVWL